MGIRPWKISRADRRTAAKGVKGSRTATAKKK